MPLAAPAAPPPPPRKRYEQQEIFDGLPQKPDYGTAPDGWKPYRPPPQLKTRSGARILTVEEHEAYMRRKWLGPQEAAAVLGISDQQIYNLIAEGALKATHISLDPQAGARKHYRIATDEIRAFLTARSTDHLGT